MAIVKFSVDGHYDRRLWILGSIGSLINCVGTFFSISSYATGKPAGPIAALQATQMIMVTIIDSIRFGEIPHYMQLIGLLIGIVGTLVLSMPD